MEELKDHSPQAVDNFNAYTTEFRFKVEGLVKQLLFVSGGIQTITISAFISGTRPVLSEEGVSLLKCGWEYLSASIILCLILMFLQVIALAHVSSKQAHKIKNNIHGVEVMNTWPVLRVINWCVGLAAFFTCLLGVYTVSKAAITLIGTV